jgi:hypothetical protein
LLFVGEMAMLPALSVLRAGLFCFADLTPVRDPAFDWIDMVGATADLSAMALSRLPPERGESVLVALAAAVLGESACFVRAVPAFCFVEVLWVACRAGWEEGLFAAEVTALRVVMGLLWMVEIPGGFCALTDFLSKTGALVRDETLAGLFDGTLMALPGAVCLLWTGPEEGCCTLAVVFVGLGDCFLMGVIVGLALEITGFLFMVGAVWIVTLVDLRAGVGFLEAIGLMSVDLDTADLEEARDLIDAGAVLSGILIVFWPAVIIVLCLTLEELLGLEVADLEVVLGITTLLRELVAGLLEVDEDLVLLIGVMTVFLFGVDILEADLVLLIGVMTVLLFGVDFLEADLVGVATSTDLLIGGE